MANKKLKKSTVLIVGGAGFIGVHTCMLLKNAGYSLVIFDNFTHGTTGYKRLAQLEQGNLADSVRLGAVLRKTNPMAVIHCAASSEVGESMSNPAKYYANNVTSTFNLLNSMRDNGVNRLVFSSTCAVYGLPRHIPIVEDHPSFPVSPYGNTKLICELMVKDFSKAYGLNAVIFRYFNAAGADPSGKLGNLINPRNNLITIILETILGKRSSFVINGRDHHTPDGTCIRDYTHVLDIAHAHKSALDYLSTNSGTAVINIGSGEGVSVIDLIKVIEKVTGRKVPLNFGTRRPSDPDQVVSDISKAATTLRWHPQYSLEDIVSSSWKWYQSQT